MNPFKKGNAVNNSSFGNGFIVEADPDKDWCGVDFYDRETGTIVRKNIAVQGLTRIERDQVTFPHWALAEHQSGKDRFWRMRSMNSPRGPITTEVKFQALGFINPGFAQKALEYAHRLVFSQGWCGDPLDDPNAEPKTKVELFCNTFLGKLGHCALYQFLTSRKAPNGEAYMVSGFDAFLGFSVNKYQDLTVNLKPILIRTTKSKGQLLILSKYDWGRDGKYRKNKQRYVYVFLARIENDPETILRAKGLFDKEYLSIEETKAVFADVHFYYDIPGFITRNDLLFLMESGFSIHKGNGYSDLFHVDSESWYCQCHDLRPVRSFNP